MGGIELRCGSCGRAFTVPGLEHAYFPTWDHLLDHHADEVLAGRASAVLFRSPAGELVSI